MVVVSKKRLAELEEAKKKLGELEAQKDDFARLLGSTLETFLRKVPWQNWPRVARLAFSTASLKDKEAAKKYKEGLP